MYELRKIGPESESESHYEIIELPAERIVGAARVRGSASTTDLEGHTDGAGIALAYDVTAYSSADLPDLVSFVLKERPKIWIRAQGEWVPRR